MRQLMPKKSRQLLINNNCNILDIRVKELASMLIKWPRTANTDSVV